MTETPDEETEVVESEDTEPEAPANFNDLRYSESFAEKVRYNPNLLLSQTGQFDTTGGGTLEQHFVSVDNGIVPDAAVIEDGVKVPLVEPPVVPTEGVIAEYPTKALLYPQESPQETMILDTTPQNAGYEPVEEPQSEPEDEDKLNTQVQTPAEYSVPTPTAPQGDGDPGGQDSETAEGSERPSEVQTTDGSTQEVPPAQEGTSQS